MLLGNTEARIAEKEIVSINDSVKLCLCLVILALKQSEHYEAHCQYFNV